MNMHIINDYTSCPDAAHHAVIALGNFDGVHLGHQHVIEFACDIAKHEHKPSAVMTFEPHPVSVLKPDVAPFRLSSAEDKARYIEAIGVDYLFSLPFNEALYQRSADAFIKDILVDDLKVSHVVIGYDFIFGHKRSGNADLLQRAGQQYGFGFSQLNAVGDDATIYSSTLVRKSLAKGDLATVRCILGRNHMVTGVVSLGQQKGRTLGFPTANIDLGQLARPCYGVYAVHVTLGAKHYEGVANIGVRPTVDGQTECLEVHLFDFEGDLYGQKISVELVAFLRPEKKFSSLEALQQAIGHDCQQAKQALI